MKESFIEAAIQGAIGGAILTIAVLIYRFYRRNSDDNELKNDEIGNSEFRKKEFQNKEIGNNGIGNRNLINEFWEKNNNRRIIRIFLFLMFPYLYIFKSAISILFLNNGRYLELGGDKKTWLEPYSVEEILLNPSIHEYVFGILLIPYVIMVVLFLKKNNRDSNNLR